MKLLKKPQINSLLLMLGILAVIASFVPYFILGQDSFIEQHDQLDGEFLVYLINAKNFLKPSFAEFMNGMAATSLTPASYGSLIFYLIFKPFTAFIINYIFVAIIAFAGMYLLLNKLINNKWIAFIVGIMFSQLPFYSVYGLSVMGQPLLFYALLCIINNERPWKSYIITVVFAFFSSLVLVGFADILILFLCSLWLFISKNKSAKYVAVQTAVLFLVFVLPNISLIGQILTPSDTVSHKTELLLSSMPFFETFKEMFFNGQYHAASNHSGMVYWIIGICAVSVLFIKQYNKKEKGLLYCYISIIFSTVFIALFYAFWHWYPVVSIRNRIGGVFTSFQIDRIYWLYPTLWFVLLAIAIWFLWRMGKGNIYRRVISYLLIAAVLLPSGINVYKNSNFKINSDMLLSAEKRNAVYSYNDFYSPELFGEIKDYIGLPQSDYRVASIALYPSVPLYNGFYCIDGYSNNYDVQYKHNFRKIIAKELEKNSHLANYYDNWGNRCYLFSAQTGQKYFFTADSKEKLSDLQLSGEALANMNCDYVISGLEITNPQQSGLEFEKNFQNSKSPYCIYLYKVKK